MVSACRSRLMIRLARHGCVNRPFYHLVVMHQKHAARDPVLEQVGSVDPLSNENNERIVAVNFDRVRYWMAKGAGLTPEVSKLLGLSGFLPIHPYTIMQCRRNERQETTPSTE